MLLKLFINSSPRFVKEYLVLGGLPSKTSFFTISSLTSSFNLNERIFGVKLQFNALRISLKYLWYKRLMFFSPVKPTGNGLTKP